MLHKTCHAKRVDVFRAAIYHEIVAIVEPLHDVPWGALLCAEKRNAVHQKCKMTCEERIVEDEIFGAGKTEVLQIIVVEILDDSGPQMTINGRCGDGFSFDCV